MSRHLCCYACGSVEVGPIDLNEPEWLLTLRQLPGWDERGTPFEYLLWKNGWADALSEDELETASESFASTQKKTLAGYVNMVAAFKTHIAKGYHRGREKQKDGLIHGPNH